MSAKGGKIDKDAWIRRETVPAIWANKGWVAPMMLLGLLGVGVLWVAPEEISPQIRDAVQVRFAATAMPLHRVDVNGQDLELWVKVPDQGTKIQKEHLRALAQTTRCSTWLGRWPCAARVRVHTELVAESLAEPNAKTEFVAMSSQPFHLRFANQELWIHGVVGSQTELAKLGHQAQRQWPKAKIYNALSVVPGKGQQQEDPRQVAAALQLLGMSVEGQAHWEEGQMRVQASADPEQHSKMARRFARSWGGKGMLELKKYESMQLRCARAMNQLLQGHKIRFRTASRRIHPQSYPVLEQLAQQAQRCEGEIVIQGHTDNVGREDSNLRLSQQRADAVRKALIQRGVSATRLTAQGMGASSPIASNDTWSGRAENRRIEFRLQSSNEQPQESTTP